MALLQIVDLLKKFPIRQSGGIGRVWNSLRGMGAEERGEAGYLHAVDGVTFSIEAGESVGLVGESGCGKSTLARLIARLQDPTSGAVAFEGRNIGGVPASRFIQGEMRRKIQMVFQDPTESLNPGFTTFRVVADPLLRLGGMRSGPELRKRVEELCELVGLAPEFLTRYPHQLSGGQKARVGIARAIALEPSLLILDEPTSALDVSVQAVILHLLEDLKSRLGMSYLFVSQDLNIVRLLCQRVLVMYLGKIVEAGPTREILRHPRHPYTRALLSAIPAINTTERTERVRLTGEPMSPIDPSPHVCRFYSRCPQREDRCQEEMPMLTSYPGGIQTACHFPLEKLENTKTQKTIT